MTPEKFIETWLGNPLSERAGAQGYVDDLCDVLKVDKPRKHGQYQYEYGAKKTGAGDGFADVWKQGYFGWENKKPGRDLKAALKQLTDYSLSLESPPLLVVCDRERIEIHTAFTGYPDEVTTILLSDIGNHDNLKILKWVFEDPEKLRPKKSTSAITEEAAGKFAGIAESMRSRDIDPQKVAHFLIQCLFCMFAEDEGLLPNHVLSNLLLKAKDDPSRATKKLGDLFKAMRKGGDYGDEIIDYFNGGLFSNIDVPELEVAELNALASAAIDMDWRAIEPAIFGTLFERGLNPKKRSQLSIECSPANVMGIELDPYAAELARVTVWIGELQWMLQNGYEYNKNPILKPLHNIENRDALIGSDGIEAVWPTVDVIIGNPPFLGGSKKRGELGTEYFNKLSRIYGSGEDLNNPLACMKNHLIM